VKLENRVLLGGRWCPFGKRARRAPGRGLVLFAVSTELDGFLKDGGWIPASRARFARPHVCDRGHARSPLSLSLSLSRLRGVQRRFEEWRGERKGQAGIPEPLWTVAVKMAETYGVNQAATALRLDY